MRPLNLRIFACGITRSETGVAECAAIVKDADSGDVIKELHISIGCESLDLAEYQSVVLGLKEALSLDAESVMVVVSSELLIRRLTGDPVNGVDSRSTQVTDIRAFEGRLGIPVRYRFVPKDLNKEVYELANKVIDAGCA